MAGFDVFSSPSKPALCNRELAALTRGVGTLGVGPFREWTTYSRVS